MNSSEINDGAGRHVWWRRTFLVAALFVAQAPPVWAVRPMKSLYTALDLEHCVAVPGSVGKRALRCQGLGGMPLLVAEGQSQYFLSAGAGAESRRAASQTLGAFNTLFAKSARRAAIEWRFVIRDGKPAPYAMIVRYFTRQGRRTGEVLVVSRISDDETCHVAYVDAVANANPMAIARRIADVTARQFDCKSDPIKAGATGASPM